MKAPFQAGDKVVLDGKRSGTFLCQEDYQNSRFRLDDQDARLAFVAQTNRLAPVRPEIGKGLTPDAATPGVRAMVEGGTAASLRDPDDRPARRAL